MQANTNLYQTQISKKITHGSVKTIVCSLIHVQSSSRKQNKLYSSMQNQNQE